jgi:NADH-quinone oxidoreductase subunit N
MFILLCGTALFTIFTFSSKIDAQIGLAKRLAISMIVATLTPLLILLVSVNDLVALYLIIEIVSVMLYILPVLDMKNSSLEAAVKYFVQGAVASALIVFSIVILSVLFGTTNILDIQ